MIDVYEGTNKSHDLSVDHCESFQDIYMYAEEFPELSYYWKDDTEIFIQVPAYHIQEH